MFRSATARQSDLAQRRFQAHKDSWNRTAADWFDGTVASIDERLARLDNTLAFARDTVARLGSTPAGYECIGALPQLEQTRLALNTARESLLNGFSDRQADRSVPAGRRTASKAPVAALDAPAPIHRAIELGSRSFLAKQNTDDHDELMVRAARYADEQVSTLPIYAARPLKEAFLARIEQLIATQIRPRVAAKVASVYEDFDDALMY